MTLEMLIDFIRNNGVEALAAWGAIITLASIIIKITPSKKDDTVWSVILNVLNALALNPHKKDQEALEEKIKEELNERNDARTTNSLTNALK